MPVPHVVTPHTGDAVMMLSGGESVSQVPFDEPVLTLPDGHEQLSQRQQTSLQESEE